MPLLMLRRCPAAPPPPWSSKVWLAARLMELAAAGHPLCGGVHQVQAARAGPLRAAVEIQRGSVEVLAIGAADGHCLAADGGRAAGLPAMPPSPIWPPVQANGVPRCRAAGPGQETPPDSAREPRLDAAAGACRRPTGWACRSRLPSSGCRCRPQRGVERAQQHTSSPATRGGTSQLRGPCAPPARRPPSCASPHRPPGGWPAATTARAMGRGRTLSLVRRWPSPWNFFPTGIFPAISCRQR